jgi:phenylacetate-coenzyme A ligase PaaK-like adenylate-forming protein
MAKLAERIVWAVPALGNLAATFCGWKLDRRRYGRLYHQTVSEVLERNTWPRELLLEYQSEKLRHLIRHAVEHVPYYRELFQQLGLSSEDIKTVQDLPSLPILEKSQVREDPVQFVDERLDLETLIPDRTTGSTGTPIKIFKTSDVLQRHYAYFDVRCRRTAGIAFGREPYVMLGIQIVAPPSRTHPPFWCYNYVHQQLYMSAFHLSPIYLSHYCQEIKKRPYHAIMGYPSALQALAQYVLDTKGSGFHFETAVTSGEVLHPHQRRVIEQAFGCRVFDQYGCTEICVFASQCQEGAMHVSPDYGVLEIVDDDGKPVPVGTTGEIICTGLVNDAHVLIRYRLGDRGALSDAPCRCGSPLPVLKSIEGRTGDVFVLPNGRRLGILGDEMYGVSSVAEWQLVQEAPDLFTMYVVPAKGYTPTDSEQILKNLSHDMPGVNIHIKTVPAIERGPGGKRALYVSLLGS